MDQSERVDLSPLDPAVDAHRWRTVVDATLARVDVALSVRQRDPLTLIAGWSRSLLVTGAAVVLILIPVDQAMERREAQAEQVETLVRLSTETALGAGAPTGEELSDAIGGELLP